MQGFQVYYARLSHALFLSSLGWLVFLCHPVQGQSGETNHSESMLPGQEKGEVYDSIYQRSRRHKITKLLYPIAFTDPNKNKTDPLQTNVSEAQYLPFEGKVIRQISITSVKPFGSSLYDTVQKDITAVGKALNSAHMNTQKYRIRQHLLFKKGDRVNAQVLADNERQIRELGYIDNVRFFITECSPGSDSVDILIMTKDVWSIGLYVRSITTSTIRMNVYDANFLGLGDKINIKISAEGERAPFFRFDGCDYTYENIEGSFINGRISLSQDNDGNENAGIGFSRNLFSITTRWEGGIFFDQSKKVEDLNDSTVISSRFQEELAWGGLSFPLKEFQRPSRIIISQSFYNRHFLDRPVVTAQSDPFYFNTRNILTGISYSWNKSYITHYLSRFGQPENLPFGRLIQLNIGPSITDFTNRIYSCLILSAGDYIRRTGYLSVTTNLGGYFHKESLEDGALMVTVNYIPNLYTTRNKRYKFRTYLIGQYAFSFNRSSNNLDLYDLNTLFNVSGLEKDTALEGFHCLGIKAGTVNFTPWEWYHFRFAITSFIQGGVVAQQSDLLKGTFYGGLGVALAIKNDNLIFPPFRISFTVYPGCQPNVPPFWVDVNSISQITLPDFVPDYPTVQTLGK